MFDFINNNFDNSFSEIIKEKLYLEEKKNIRTKNTGLYKVKVLFNPDKYQVLKLTLDINNVDKNLKRLLPFLKKEISSVDNVLFVKRLKDDKYFLFHIELKSKTIDNKLVKKYYSSAKLLHFIFEMLYLNYKEEKEKEKRILDFDFPKKIYNVPVLIASKSSSGGVEEIKVRNKEDIFYNNHNFKYLCRYCGLKSQKGSIILEKMCNKVNTFESSLDKIEFF
ncbi:hypothetical protein [Leptotrichia shahii]|uniref:hypothetical protein n=1 Tax=Leptotrichia shahii TaxID=157691 RepID=UPI0028D854C7|nr:hypothetical protein [Leptotrichia shahii]